MDDLTFALPKLAIETVWEFLRRLQHCGNAQVTGFTRESVKNLLGLSMEDGRERITIELIAWPVPVVCDLKAETR